MKPILFFFLFIFQSYTAQNLIVEYVEKWNNGEDKYNSFLVIKENETYYMLIGYKFYKNYEELLADKAYLEDTRYNIGSLKTKGDSVYYKVKNVKGIVSVYKDTVPKINWDISNEKETYLGYPCAVAYTEFRGRKYKVLFTGEIPVSAGPWKLSGLPGLILKANTENNEFVWEATKIRLNSPLDIPEKFYRLYKNADTENLPYQVFIEKENAEFEEIGIKARASLPKNIVLTDIPDVRSELQETTFEWEEPKKTK